MILEFLDIINIKWKSIFKSTKRERVFAFVASYFLTGTLLFIFMFFYSPGGGSESMGIFAAFLLYWFVVLIIPFILPMLAVAHVVTFFIVTIPFCVPVLFIWLGKRSKSRVRGITFCALSGSTFAFLCSMGFYFLGRYG